MLHKRWKDYTDDEIREIDAEKCSKCKYKFVTRVINYKKRVWMRIYFINRIQA